MDEPLYSFPSKKKIRKILHLYNVNTTHIIFSAEYESGKRVGILWRRNDIKIQMIGIEEHFKKHKIEISNFKDYGEINSIWFVKKIIEN